MVLFYSRINWENFPSVNTALNAINLNAMDYAVKTLDERTVELDTTKANQSVVLNTIQDWYMDEENGIITITKVNGEQIMFDLNIEKIPIKFELSQDGILSMTTDDGTVFTANIGSMIPVMTFENTDTISVKVVGEGKDKTYSFEVKDGSITEEKLRPNYLAEIKVQAENASMSATASAESATASSQSATEAQNYAEQAKESAGNALGAVENVNNKQTFNKPIFLFVDDDGASQFNDLYTEVLEPRGIVGGLAVISNAYDTEYFTYLTQEEILGYQSKGWSILNHSSSGDSITLENVDVNLPYAINKFEEKGYENKHNIFVYPNGNYSDDADAIAEKVSEYFSYGFNIAVDNNQKIGLPITDKYNMGRVFISADLEDSTKTFIKSCIDDAIANNSMLIISTHASSYNKEYLCEVIDYIQGLGYDFTPPDEAFDMIESNTEQLIEERLRETVPKATADAEGNVITETYATKTEVMPVNNLLATVAGKPLDAVQGKLLNDKISAIPSIIFATEDPDTVPENTIVMVYEE